MSDTSPQPLPPPYLRREAERQLPEIEAAVRRVCASGCFLFGAELAGFEAELAAAQGRAHAVGVGSGTDALHLALRALGIGPGDEVITQTHSSPFTVTAIHMVGAQPVLVESSEDDFGMDPEAARRAITKQTRAILPVHLYGQPVRIAEIAELAKDAGLHLVEDCAQAQGACAGGRLVGTFGELACFSFYPTKNLGSLGDGGAVVTDSAALAQRVRSLRNGGLVAPGLHAERGVTSRLNEVQAAVLRLRLRELERGNDARRAHAEAWRRELRGVVTPTERAGTQWAPHYYVIRHPQRDAIRAAAARAGFALLVHYPLPIHLQQGFRSPRYPEGSFPVAERLAAEVLSLPTHPDLTAEERARIAAVATRAARAEPSPCEILEH
jgi:dTDP-4-amino-4,6-dideoxygalactose transaminase